MSRGASCRLRRWATLFAQKAECLPERGVYRRCVCPGKITPFHPNLAMRHRSSAGVCGLDVDILEKVGSNAVVGVAIEQHVDANAVKFSAHGGHDFHRAFDKVEFAEVAVVV